MAGHWILVTRSWLISFFLNLTSYILSLASSCNDQIPNRNTPSASQDGTSPTPCPMVDNSFSVRVHVPPPIDDGAIRTLNAHGTRSTMTARSSWARTFDSSRPGLRHPIASLFQRQKLGKEVLGFAIPMTTGLLFNQYRGLTHLQASAAILTLSFGFTATWNSMLLRGMCPQFATAMEYLGVGSVLVTFFGLVSSFLPPSLAWASWLCCGLSCLPFLLCLVLPTAVEEERSAERLDQGIV